MPKPTIGKKSLRINDEINAREVLLIGPDGEQLGVTNISAAKQNAEQAGLDLVEISPNVDPPVCRVMDYGKYLYQTKKSVAKKPPRGTKEVKFRPSTEEADFQVKLRNIIRFLTSGNKVKVSLRFRGREMAHQELGTRLLKRVADEIETEAIGVVEMVPKIEGRQMVMLIGPKKP